MKKSRKTIQAVAWILAATGLIISIGFLVSVAKDGIIFWGKETIDFEKTGQFGDFIGGFVGTIFSAAGFIFLYLTLVDQRDANLKERFESRFFELLRFHRENAGELSYQVSQFVRTEEEKKAEIVSYQGKQVFKAIFEQFNNVRNELKPFFNAARDDIYLASYLDQLAKNKDLNERKIDYKLLASIDISYSIVFFGVGAEGVLILTKLFSDRYSQRFTGSIIKYIQLKPLPAEQELWRKWIRLSKINNHLTRLKVVSEIYLERKGQRRNPSLQDIELQNSKEDIIQGYHNEFTKFYGGHQFRLGHYFRHLFQTVKYVNDQTFLKYPEKYEYVKTLRAQLSTYEQAIFFFNSLCKIGQVWELYPALPKSEDHDTKTRMNKQLITKYNLIKNLPGETLYGIPFKTFYPQVQYEGTTEARDNSLYT